MKEEPVIGIFDSGVGGFTVYKKIKEVTSANCIYYGDCLNAPYGNKEESEIRELIKADILFLEEKGVTHFVNACNSMSVLTTDALLKESHIPTSHYTDMIRAFDNHAVCNEDETVLVIATTATIRSGVYQDVLKRKGVNAFGYAYTDLAAAIEHNASREELLSIVEKGIVYAKEVGAARIIYGCTHYPLIHGLFLEVKDKLNWQGEFIDPAIYVAEEVRVWGITGEHSFCPYSSKDTPAFIKNVIKFV